MSNVQHSHTVLKTSQNTSPKSFITHSLTHIHTNKFFYPKRQGASTLYTADRVSWRDLAGLAQGLLVHLDKPVMWRDLASLAPKKKIRQHPLDKLRLSVQFFRF